MSDAEQLRQRAKLMLRAERALGVTGIVAPAIFIEEDPPAAVVRSRAAPIAQAPAAETKAAEAKSVAQPSVLFEGGDETVAKRSVFGPERPPFESAVLSKAQKLVQLDALNVNEVKGCPKCILCKTRTNTVFGEGDSDARLMFIGEGPGENEDLQSRPFIGRAGELLNKQIAAMGLKREEVFIANIVKCRPPNNRVPAPDEVAACTPYLERQIEIIRPHVIVTLGLPSTQYMLQTKNSMSKMRGNWHTWRGIKLMPTYHPAYLLRNYTDATRAAVWSDLKKVMSELGLKKDE